ncbi:Anaphase-promoting complex subunit 4, WD40 domain [Dillenia turbinata]|uniref:Anaphase-promoting complex subunit 4 n=1 Tax=Dillenia turbinata TaxID=194707 RepID=A0AAN8VN04_9MAGN
METDEPQRFLPFQLQFDKPVASQIKIAEWNPEKDLLAMVTEDSKIVLHRFNWQRLWTISPGKCVTSLCWRPDGKVIAAGLEDGAISLHDVENGKLLRRTKSHAAAVVCLNWEEEGQLLSNQDEYSNVSAYEDRTSRFFPPAPRVPRMPGLVSGDASFTDDGEDSFLQLSNSSHQRFNMLCSGDKKGIICFSIFGIFPIAELNIHKVSLSTPLMGIQHACQLLSASIYKLKSQLLFYSKLTVVTFGFCPQVALSKDLSHLLLICSGQLVEDKLGKMHTAGCGLNGLQCLVLDTSIFLKRKNELHQVAQQASNIEDLTEVIRVSLSSMYKQWSDSMRVFHEKFDSLSNLIVDHGLDSSPQEEFLSLLNGARTSPPVHQFLVNSLGELGLKRVSKAVCSAGKELQLIVLDHLQPAAEIIGFRMGELRGLSRWRARYQGIGLDEKLISDATEKAGMLLVQIERFMRVLSSVVQQFSNFFSWLLKCIKTLMSEPIDQPVHFNSEHVVIFLKFLYDQDPVSQLLDPSKVDHCIGVDLETMERTKELVNFGGFSDVEYLRRTLAKEFQLVESSFKDAFLMPFTTISKKILCEDLLHLVSFPSLQISEPLDVPTSITYYKGASLTVSSTQTCCPSLDDYISFRVPDDSYLEIANCIGIARGFMHELNSGLKGYDSVEAALLCVPEGYDCVDLSFYKEGQVVLLLNETTMSESSGNSCMMVVQASDLPFIPLTRASGQNYWNFHELKDSVVNLQMENEKVRSIPHTVMAPLAVSASRGVACVFAARKRALVYILDEDEDEQLSEAE